MKTEKPEKAPTDDQGRTAAQALDDLHREHINRRRRIRRAAKREAKRT